MKRRNREDLAIEFRSKYPELTQRRAEQEPDPSQYIDYGLPSPLFSRQNSGAGVEHAGLSMVGVDAAGFGCGMDVDLDLDLGLFAFSSPLPLPYPVMVPVPACEPALLSKGNGNGNSHHRQRFQSVLYAATAMTRHPGDLPLTYLNKGQPYALAVTDTSPASHQDDDNGYDKDDDESKVYRTTVKVLFDEDEQRSKVASSWKLWQQGRGILEAAERTPGQIRAIECDPHATPKCTVGGEQDQLAATAIVVQESFDGFVVDWKPQPGARVARTVLALRCHFLSTDFSHSKGVKGIPVRLSVKTVVCPANSRRDGFEGDSNMAYSEASYCRVKLFRDKGAERKFANDVQHVRKTIEKLRLQATDPPPFAQDQRKRRRGGNRRHVRTLSAGSESSIGSATSDGSLKMDRATQLEAMLTTSRPISILDRVVDPEEDMDLAGAIIDPLVHDQAPHTLRTDVKMESHPAASPTLTLLGSDTRRSPDFDAFDQSLEHGFVAASRTSSDARHLSSRSSVDLRADKPYDLRQHNQANDPYGSTNATDHHGITTEHADHNPGANVVRVNGRAIEAVGIDPHYVVLPSHRQRPACCLFVQPRIAVSTYYASPPLSINSPILSFCSNANAMSQSANLYHAVYLRERSADSFVHSVAKKLGVDPGCVVQCARENTRGLKILVDDEVVQEIPEGQDMLVELREVRPGTALSFWPSRSTTRNMVGDDQGCVFELVISY